MTDRFDAQLRQHLLGTADERPAEAQLATIVARTATTPQRRPLTVLLPGLFGWVRPLPAAVRFGLLAVALVLAAMAGAILAAGGSTPPSTPFEGTWTTIDRPDGSTMNLYVGAGSDPTVRFEDLDATGDGCVNDEVKVFTAEGVGEITGNRLEATFPNGGGCGLDTVSVAGVYVYDRSTDTLRDQDGLIWTRVPGGDGPRATLPPEPSSTPGRTFEGRWTATDLGDESTLTLVVGEGLAPVVQFQDDLSTGGACDADDVKVFRADGVGEITGNRLVVTYPDGGGCGLTLIPIGGRYDHDADTDTLVDQDGVIWTRVPESPDPAPTLRPAPTPRPGPTGTPLCIDLAQGGTYTESPGFQVPAPPVSITASIPGTPRTPWLGSVEYFRLADACEEGGTIAILAGTGTGESDSSCWPQTGEIESFADALARLDTPSGDDITDRIDLAIDGYAAARYDITSLRTCSGFGLWSGTIMGVGETGSMYLVDVDGVLVAIELNLGEGAQTQAELEEAHAIIASLQITR